MTSVRTYVITGSASGMGKATRERLETAGHRVIGVDLHDADLTLDLATPEGRLRLVDGVQAAVGDSIDAVIACAGLSPGGAGSEVSSRIDNTSPEMIVRVNYFGAIATLEGLRPFLVNGNRPRAVAVSSTGLLAATDSPTIDLLLAGNEEGAVASALRNDGTTAYRSTKRALARWIRQQAPSEAWAASGIALNSIAPGFIITPMSEPVLALPYQELVRRFPSFPEMPFHGPGDPEHAASLIDWLSGPENMLVTGQVIFIDGGFDCVKRGDDVW